MIRDSPKRRDGWWWKFTALVLGAPPVAVWAAEDEVEQERAEPPSEDDTRA